MSRIKKEEYKKIIFLSSNQLCVRSSGRGEE